MQTVSYLSSGATVTEAVDSGTYTVQLDVQECDSYNAATLTDPNWTFTIGPKQLSDLDFSDITVAKVYDGTTGAGILAIWNVPSAMRRRGSAAMTTSRSWRPLVLMPMATSTLERTRP